MVVLLEVMVVSFWKKVQGNRHTMIPQVFLTLHTFCSVWHVSHRVFMYSFLLLSHVFQKADLVVLSFVHFSQWLFVHKYTMFTISSRLAKALPFYKFHFPLLPFSLHLILYLFSCVFHYLYMPTYITTLKIFFNKMKHNSLKSSQISVIYF